MQTITLQTRGGESRIFHHRGSKADLGVIEQVFKNQDYSLHRLRRSDELHSGLQVIVSGGHKPLIVDAGANIGASVVWFALNYPQSHVVALEPDYENFKLLCDNASGLDVDLRNVAVGSINGKVRVVDPGEGEWGYRTSIDEQGSCQLVSMSDLIEEKMQGGYTPFIAKIDIEGGESNLFEQQTDWVEKFPILIIELHDWLLPNQNTSRTFLRCISQYDRDFVPIGENIFSLKIVDATRRGRAAQ
jgi:FkbM family methyltransferase